MSEFVKEHNEQLHFFKLYCDKGHYITNYNDGDDILTFNASKIMYCPDSVDVDATYHCITEYKYGKYCEMKAKAEEEKMVDEIYQSHPDDPASFMDELVRIFGEDSEKVKEYFEKYYPQE